MKNYLIAILLASLPAVTLAEPRARQLRVMCGSLEDVTVTMEKYGETLVMASMAPNKETMNLLYVNFETQTSSWFVRDIGSDEYCMVGVGDNLHIPKESPLNLGTGIGTKTLYK